MSKTIKNSEYQSKFIELIDTILYKKNKNINTKETHLINKIKFISIKEYRISNITTYFSKNTNNLNKFTSLVEYLLPLSEKINRIDNGTLLFFICTVTKGIKIEKSQPHYNNIKILLNKISLNYSTNNQNSMLSILTFNNFLLFLIEKNHNNSYFLFSKYLSRHGNYLFAHLHTKLESRTTKTQACRYLLDTIEICLASETLSNNLIFPYFYKIFMHTNEYYLLLVKALNKRINYCNITQIKENHMELIKKLLIKALEYNRTEIVILILKDLIDINSENLYKYIKFTITHAKEKHHIQIKSILEKIIKEKKHNKKSHHIKSILVRSILNQKKGRSLNLVPSSCAINAKEIQLLAKTTSLKKEP
jgi:hypothetical protein